MLEVASQHIILIDQLNEFQCSDKDEYPNS